MNLYSLFDRKQREFGQIISGSNDEAVKRELRSAQKRSEAGNMHLYPEDFDLMYLGRYIVETGVIEPQVPAKLVVNVGEYVASFVPAGGVHAG